MQVWVSWVLSGSHRVKSRSWQGYNIIWGLEFSSRLNGCQPDSFPCSCITVVPVFLLAVGWGTLSAPRHHPQVLATWTPPLTICFLLGQQESISLTCQLLLKGSLVRSGPPGRVSLWLTQSQIISNIIIGAKQHHIHWFYPAVKERVLYRPWTPEGGNLRGLLKILPTVDENQPFKIRERLPGRVTIKYKEQTWYFQERERGWSTKAWWMRQKEEGDEWGGGHQQESGHLGPLQPW